MTIYMPPDPSGWGPALTGGINKFAEVYSRLQEEERKKQEEANKFLLNAIMQYGGTVSPEQMGQMEQTMGMTTGPGLVGKIQNLIRGGTPSEVYGPESIIAKGQPKQTSPLRSLFEEIPEGGFKFKGQAERSLETFKKQKEIEEPYEVAKEERGFKKQKELVTFQTDEEIRGELAKIDQLEPKKRAIELDRLKAIAEQNEKLEAQFFGSKLERLKQEKIATGDIATTQAIDLLQKEAPIKWKELKKEIEERGKQARLIEQAKEELGALKERKRDYERTKALLKVTKPMKLEGEEVTEDELEEIRRVVTMQGFDVESVPIKKKTLGVDWIAADKFTFRIVDPETGMPPKVYEGIKEKTVPSETKIVKPDWIVDPKTGKVKRNK